MQYTYFKIKNFKGIGDVTIDVQPRGGPSIVTLVGLNESGKTTILEAIHSFSPDEDTNVLLSGKTLEKVAPESLIPRQDQANFNGIISVTAGLAASPEDWVAVRDAVLEEYDLVLDLESLPSTFEVERRLTFKASKHVATNVNFLLEFNCIEKGKRKPRQAEGEARVEILSILRETLPAIKYFPTFLFEFPDKIYLNGKADGRNAIYRSMFQDVLAATGRNYTIEDHIVGRLGFSPEKHGVFSAFLNLFIGSWDKTAIDSVVSDAGATVTSVVMNRWNEVFSDKIQNKEIVIEFETVKSPDSEAPLAAVRFWVKEGLDRFKVSERSLGFRWFLCFLLFTQFRAASDQVSSTLFLFDEPASNLHARAQQQLLGSFLSIVGRRNGLIYSTHSHHMINPAWLEMTYIIENAAIQYDADEFVGSWDRKTEISAVPYRRFVGQHPEKRSYFQPILDKLDYAPSALEFINNAVLAEGKSDFYILKYFSEIIFKKSLDIIPSTGANDLGPIIALYLGWGKKFVILLDGDKTGKAAKKRYIDEFFLTEQSVVTLPELAKGSKVTAVESVLGDEITPLVQARYEITRKPSKKEVTRYFQEIYAAKTVVKFKKPTLDRVESVIDGLAARLASA